MGAHGKMICYEVGGAVRDALLGLPVHDRDWVVVDNFRIIYFGTEDPSGIQDVIAAEPAHTGKIYNLQGVEVSRPAHGIYVRDGRKVVIK